MKRNLKSSTIETNHKKNKTNRPYSSLTIQPRSISSKNRRSYKLKQKPILTEPSVPNKQTSKNRPMTAMDAIMKSSLYQNQKDKKFNELNLLNLIIETSPSKYNYDKVHQKLKNINPLYSSKYSNSKYSFPSVLSKRTEEIYYNYNILYGTNSNNIITTYSPKMRPMSASVSSYVKNMYIGNDDNYVFTDEEIEELTKAKCEDLNIELRENMINKFQEYCQAKCINRIIDFTNCNIGLYSTQLIAKILSNSDRIARLNLSKNNIGDKGLEILCESFHDSKSLISLNVSSNSITPKGGQKVIHSLLNQNSLIEINLSSLEGIHRNRISTEGLKEIEDVLSQNFYIEEFNVGGNSIKNEGWKLIVNGLNKNTILNTLNISRNDIDSNGLILGLESLKQSKIVELNISENPIHNEGIIKLAESFNLFPNLKRINLSNCKITFKGVFYLFMNLQNTKRIESVTLSGNDISSNNFKQILPFFQVIGVKNLNLSNCSLGDKSGAVLGECLASNEQIKKVDISENNISDKGFKSFMTLFSHNNTIVSFDISKNFISDTSAKNFIKNIKFNRTLKEINFYDNQLKNESASEFIDILNFNRILTYINLGFNRVQMKLIDEIKKSLAVNVKRQKMKFVPNIIKEIDDLYHEPNEAKELKIKIEIKENNRSAYTEKLKEDIVEIAANKKEIEEKKNKSIEQRKMIEREIEEIVEEMKKISDKIESLKNDEKVQEKNLLEKIENEERILEEKRKESIKFSSELKNQKFFEDAEIDVLEKDLKKILLSIELGESRLKFKKKDKERKEEEIEAMKKPVINKKPAKDVKKGGKVNPSTGVKESKEEGMEENLKEIKGKEKKKKDKEKEKVKEKKEGKGALKKGKGVKGDNKLKLTLEKVNANKSRFNTIETAKSNFTTEVEVNKSQRVDTEEKKDIKDTPLTKEK